MVDNITMLTNLIKHSNYPVVLTGAGISTNSGIPDYRSNKGIYNNNEDISYFLSKSCYEFEYNVFFDFLKNNLWESIKNAKPNEAHIILEDLINKKYIKKIITQNIDGLHGTNQVIEFHGKIRQWQCSNCKTNFPIEDIIHDGICPKCGAPTKPRIVLYDEIIPSYVKEEAYEAVNQADLIICIGTSLKVSPFKDLAHPFDQQKLVIINKGITTKDHLADLKIDADCCEVLSLLYENLIMND